MSVDECERVQDQKQTVIPGHRQCGLHNKWQLQTLSRHSGPQVFARGVQAISALNQVTSPFESWTKAWRTWRLCVLSGEAMPPAGKKLSG